MRTCLVAHLRRVGRMSQFDCFSLRCAALVPRHRPCVLVPHPASSFVCSPCQSPPLLACPAPMPPSSPAEVCQLDRLLLNLLRQLSRRRQNHRVGAISTVGLIHGRLLHDVGLQHKGRKRVKPCQQRDCWVGRVVKAVDGCMPAERSNGWCRRCAKNGQGLEQCDFHAGI